MLPERSPLSRFSIDAYLPSRDYFAAEGGIGAPDARFGRRRVIIGRSRCRFRSFTLPDIAQHHRAVAAARLQADAWQPFVDTGRWIGIAGGRLVVWAWDAARLAEDLRRAGIADTLPTIPEGALMPPAADGIGLRRCRDGVEGVAVDGAVITHSRWWPEVPDLAEWQAFCRGAGHIVADNVPVPAVAALASLPWPVPIGRDWLLSPERIEAVALIAVAAVFAGWTVWLGVDAWQLDDAIKRVRAQRVATEQRAQPMALERQKALAEVEQIERLSALFQAPNPLAVVATVSHLLPKRGARIREFEFRDGRVKLVFDSEEAITPTALVRTFEGSSQLSDVQVASVNPSRFEVTMTYRPVQAENEALRALLESQPQRRSQAL